MKELVKTETHLHTAEVSECARMGADEAIRRCADAGYGNIVVTDHMNPELSARSARDGTDWVDAFLRGYRIAAETGARLGVRIWMGMELRIERGSEDYLIYGLDERLLRDLGDMTSLPLRRVRDRLHERGLIVYQAHPYRAYLRAADPKLLDGVEVYNGNPRHDSHNPRALAWAREHDLREIAGSDVHETGDVGAAGIYVPRDVGTSEALGAYLKRVHAPQRFPGETM